MDQKFQAHTPARVTGSIGNEMLNSQIYKTPFIVGLPVPPKQFFGRREQVEQFYGQCILGPVLQPTRILGLKRSGKTSFLNYISDPGVMDGYLEKSISGSIKFAYINAQSIHSPVEFYEATASTIFERLTNSDEEVSGLKTGRAFQKWLGNMIRANHDVKIVVLIDEFEQLHKTDAFDLEFFGLLRSIASAYPSSFTWVTASAVDLYTIDKSQKTSPFWNIFHQMPVIMGGFSNQEAHALIRDSLKLIGETITGRDLNEIISLSGHIPYFIQAVADAWQSIKVKHALPPKKIKNEVFDMLSNPGNQIQHIYRNYWYEMDENRRGILKNIASEKRNLTAAYSDLISLTDFGLLVRDNDKYGGYRISGSLLKQFFVEVDDMGNLAPRTNKRKESENKANASVVVFEVDKETHVHMGGGAYINGDVHTGGGNIGRDDNRQAGMSAADVKKLFEILYAEIDTRADLAAQDKVDLIAEIDELRKELSQKEHPDETFLMRRLRNIGKMAPDILEVTLTTITSPAAGFGLVAKKVAQKIKSSSSP